MKHFAVPPTSKQEFVQSILHEYRNKTLGDNLKRTVARIDPEVLHAEVLTFIPKDCLQILQRLGIREETVFVLPCVLKENPRLLGYYRLLMGISEKQFYAGSTGLAAFKALERDGIVSASRQVVDDLCRALNESLGSLLKRVDKKSLKRDLKELPLMTLGAYADGAWRNVVGQQASAYVFKTIKEIVRASDAQIVSDDAKRLVFRNNSAWEYLVISGVDPDISVFLNREIQTKLLCMEIKGGQDVANVHNRAGEAEKSHQKALKEGWSERWTIIYLEGLQENQKRLLQTESPSTSQWFDVNEVCVQSGKSYDSFKNALLTRFSLSSNK